MKIYKKLNIVKQLLCFMLFSFFYVTSCYSARSPTIYISFDEGFNGVSKVGNVIPEKVLFPVLVDGKKGKALKSSSVHGYLKYPAEGILDINEGTIELWVKPMDWDPSDNKFHVFFEAKSDGALYLYKYFEDSKLLFLSTDDHKNGPYYTSAKTIQWGKNEWHHLAATWSPEGILLYVDGKPISKSPADAVLPTREIKSFSIGDLPWHTVRLGTTLLDEVKIYDQALNANEIKLHYEGKYNNTSADTKSIVIRKVLSKESIKISILSSSLTNKSGDVKIRIFNSRGKEIATSESESRNIDIIESFSISDFEPGKYHIEANIYSHGKLISSARDKFEIADNSWAQVKKTTDYSIIEPWTPIQLNNGVVKMWGREYDYSSSALPVKLKYLEQNILAEPVTLKIGKGGGVKGLKARNIQYMLNQNKTTALVNSGLYKNVSDSKKLFTVENRTEFDGLSVITIRQDANTVLHTSDELVIDVPISENVAKYRHKWAKWKDWSDEVSGKLQTKQGIIDRTKFVPFYWIGNDDTGLYWFAETAKMWPNSDSSSAIQLIRKKNKTVLRLNIKRAGQPMPKDWEFTFGLQVTPVKPFNNSSRTWKISPAKDANINIIWPKPVDDSLKYYGYPEASDSKKFKKRLARMKENSIRAIPYVCPTYLSTQSPEWQLWKSNWFMGEMDSSSSDVRKYGGAFAMVSPVDGTWSNFISSKTDKFFYEYNLDGVYYDNAQPHGAYAPEAGLGFKRGNKQYKEFPILAYRELFKELYYKIKKRNKDAVIIAHTSGRLNIPALSFVDAYLDGEQFRGVVEESYSSILSLESFRSEFMGRQFGITPLFLPEFDAANSQKLKPTASMMLMLLLHDVQVWPIWSNTSYINKVHKVLDSFNVKLANFYPYFGNNRPLMVNNPEVLISSYCKKDSCLSILGNYSNKEVRTEMCLSNRSDLKVIDVFLVPNSKQNYKQNRNCISLVVASNEPVFVMSEMK